MSPRILSPLVMPVVASGFWRKPPVSFRLAPLIIAALSAFPYTAFALQSDDRNLRDNMQLEYLELPGVVDSLAGMIAGGKAYGRLRSNAFVWAWENENPAGGRPTGDNDMWGVGGSLVLKSGVYRGVSTTLGAYASLPLHDDNRIGTVNIGRSGRDTYHTRADGTEEELAVLAEASLQYQWSGSVLRAGRQLIDTLLVGSNDVKMVPNSFEALVLDTRTLPGTRLQLGVAAALKNRDRESFHSLIAWEPREENDDGFAHRGLTPAAIRAAGAEVYPELWFASLENRSLPNLRLNAEYYVLPDFFSSLVLEANYTIAAAGGWSLTPGIRWLGQIDDGAGAIGGAALSGTVRGAGQGYRDPDSVGGELVAWRAVLARGPVGLTAGWSRAADEADLIAPWRGLPTGGYTRAMGQINWQAGTETWMLKGDWDLAKAGLVPGLRMSLSYSELDMDDAKVRAGSLLSSDRNVWHLDAVQAFAALPATEFKLRLALVDARRRPATARDFESYDELRFEINHLL